MTGVSGSIGLIRDPTVLGLTAQILKEAHNQGLGEIIIGLEIDLGGFGSCASAAGGA